MTEQDIEFRRARDLERYHRQTAERRARGLCVKCGKRPPEPGRTQCEPCAAKKRPADRARHHRRTAERVDRGLCPKCGKRAPAPGRSQCEPCLEKDRAAGQARDARLRAAGIPRRDCEKAREYERERERRQTEMVQMPTATMMVVMPVPMPVGRADLGAKHLGVKHLGVPLRGRAFRSNLRFAPISTAIPDASVRSRSLRAPLGKETATPCFAVAGFAVHRPLHSCPHKCGPSCGRCRRNHRHRAAHDHPRYCPHCPPLNRRGGSLPPASPASIPPALSLGFVAIWTPFGASFLTPDASLMQGPQGCSCAASHVQPVDFAQLRAPLSCRNQCVAFATAREIC